MSGAGALVLVIEDEPKMRRLLQLILESNGLRYTDATCAREAVSKVKNQPPDLIIADLGLPDGEGIEVIRSARETSRAPILVLSARSQESDKVAALDAGADDYLTKPFSAAELLARLRVGLRHVAMRSSRDANNVFAVRDLRVDLLQRRVTMHNEIVHLTPIEYRLLICMVEKAGQVVTHSELMKTGWGPEKLDQQHYLRIYMTGLRRKLEREPSRPVYLHTETGVGYRLTAE